MPENPFFSNKAQKITCEGCSITLSRARRARGHSCPRQKYNHERGRLSRTCATSCSAKTASPKAEFSAAPTNCHDTRQDLSGRRHPNCAAFIYVSQSPLPILLQELKAIVPCNRFRSENPPSSSSTTWCYGFCKHTTENDLLHGLLAVRNNAGAHHMHDLRQLQRAPQTSAEVNTPTRVCCQPAIHSSLKITGAVCKFCTCTLVGDTKESSKRRETNVKAKRKNVLGRIKKVN